MLQEAVEEASDSVLERKQGAVQSQSWKSLSVEEQRGSKSLRIEVDTAVVVQFLYLSAKETSVVAVQQGYSVLVQGIRQRV